MGTAISGRPIVSRVGNRKDMLNVFLRDCVGTN